MDTVDFYEKDDEFEFKRNIKRMLKNAFIKDLVYLVFWAGFYWLIFGFKLPQDKTDLQMFTIGPLLVIIATDIALIGRWVMYRTATFKKVDGEYCLFRKGEKVSERVCSVVNQWVQARYNFGRYVSVIDEDGREFLLFKRLSKDDATQLSAIIADKIQIPIEIVE